MPSPKLIDTHSHVQFQAFNDEHESVVKTALENNVWMIIPGTQMDTSKDAVALATKFDEGVYAAVGIHPLHLLPLEVDQEEIKFKAHAESFDYDSYKKLAREKKVVGIGECGLEYFRIIEHGKTLNMDTNEMKQLQKTTYEQHVLLACEVDLPIITHLRPSKPEQSDAYDDALAIITKYPNLRGVVHCFTGNAESAEKFLALDFFVSFTGIITFTKDEKLLQAVKNIPLEKILIETDAPYLTPNPFRGQRNHPILVRHIAEKIATLKGLSFDEVAEQTVKNTRSLFKI